MSTSSERDGEILGPVLSFDITGSLGSVVLGFAQPDSAVSNEAIRTFEPSNLHSRNLLPAVSEVLVEAGLKVTDLALVVATRGPGSFTGLRIGLATLQGFALAGGTAVTGVSSLDAAALADSCEGGESVRRLAVVDALRGEVFAAIYDHGTSGNPTDGPVRLSPEMAAAWGRECAVKRICGPALARYREIIVDQAPGIAVGGGRVPLASAALRLGLRDVWDGNPTLKPLYLREPDIHGGRRGSGTL